MIHVLVKRHLTAVLLSILVTVVAVPSIAQSPRCIALFSRTQTDKRQWKDVKKLKVVAFNMANIYGLRGKFRRISPTEFIPIYEKPARPKSDAHVQETKDIMNDLDADIAILPEVESLSALKTLSKEINGPYESFLIEGNDARGIDIGFLVKSDLPIEAEIFTHKSREWKDPETNRKFPLFTRDLPALVLRKNNEQKPFLLVFGMHAISKRGRPGDENSTRLREAQFTETLNIISEFQQKYGRDIPLILAGDFNTDVSTAPEMESLRRLLVSAFGVAQKTIPQAERVTHTLHEESMHSDGTTVLERTTRSQLDDIRLLGFKDGTVLSASVHRYKDSQGRPRRFARSYVERQQQTSDHLPVVVEISTDAFN